MAARPLIHGTVVAFYRNVGLGAVRTTDGDVDIPFHAVAIADGTRDIAVGTPVVIEVRAGHLGTEEVRTLVPTRFVPTSGTMQP